jgi:DNA helicase-2/ATP-dependent DNA helicase PcrA
VQDATYDLARLLHAGESFTHCARWPSALKVLVVDEMHDMNQAMFTVLSALLRTNRSFSCGAGDVDQVIHRATGAEARFMRTELATLAGHKVVHYPLTHSFRFSPTLAAVAGRVANKPYASKAPHATQIDISRYDSTAECAQSVVQAAVLWKARPKAKMAEFAVLLRHPFQSVEIENALMEAGIAYQTLGLDSYVMRPEVLFLRGLLAVATDDLSSVTDTQTRKEVMRALMFFSNSRIDVEGREQESQSELLNDAIRSVTDNPMFLTSFFENQILRNAEPSIKKRLAAAVRVAREHVGPGLLDALLVALQFKAMVNNVLASQQRRTEAAANLEWLARAAARFDNPRLFFQHLNDAERKQRETRNAKTASLLIASITSVKGLEFDHVLLPYLARGEFPAPGSDMGEEWNTLYVGITRARHVLTLLVDRARPSEFAAKLEKSPKATSPL